MYLERIFFFFFERLMCRWCKKIRAKRENFKELTKRETQRKEDLKFVGLIPVKTADGYESYWQFPQVWDVDSPHEYVARRLLPEVEWLHEVMSWTGLPVDAGARNAGGGPWKDAKGAQPSRAGGDLGALDADPKEGRKEVACRQTGVGPDQELGGEEHAS